MTFLGFPFIFIKKIAICVIVRLVVLDSCQTLLIKILTTFCHTHFFYFQHHKRLKRVFQAALKEHLAF